MSETRWTKGDWRAVYDDDGCWQIECDVRSSLAIVCEDLHGGDEEEPNAHIIAAAPALYEELEEVRLAHGGAWCVTEEGRARKLRVDAALAAARGETQ